MLRLNIDLDTSFSGGFAPVLLMYPKLNQGWDTFDENWVRTDVRHLINIVERLFDWWLWVVFSKNFSQQLPQLHFSARVHI